MNKKIVALCCERSGMAAAEALGSSGIPAAVELVRLPCGGKAEIGLILKLMEEGFGGVLVLACPPDNCRFLRGSARAEKRVERTRKILEEAGLGGHRVRLVFLSALEPWKIAEAVDALRQDLERSEP